jgi:hypothetical protein
MQDIDKEIEEKYAEKWSWKIQKDEDLKKIAKDLYNNLIFTDRQCKENNLLMVFMPLMFMAPSAPNLSEDISKNRDSKIYTLLEADIEKKYYMEYIKDIGMIYEYISEAGPRSINGNPIFTSFKLLSKTDFVKMIDFYNSYKDMRELVDNF